MDKREVADRQLDALLERLDRLCDEVHSLTRRLDTQEQLLRIARELGTLNESLQALVGTGPVTAPDRCRGCPTRGGRSRFPPVGRPPPRRRSGCSSDLIPPGA